MTIAAILSTKGHEVATIESGVPLGDAVAELARRKIGALVVTEGGIVVGIVSERDLVMCIGKHGAVALERRVADAMSAPAVTVDPGTPILRALSLMTERRFRHLPIMKDGELVGLVSIGDLVKHRIDAIEHEADQMRSYIQGA